MKDWLKEYNIADVKPFIEALEKNQGTILSRRN